MKSDISSIENDIITVIVYFRFSEEVSHLPGLIGWVTIHSLSATSNWNSRKIIASVLVSRPRFVLLQFFPKKLHINVGKTSRLLIVYHYNNTISFRKTYTFIRFSLLGPRGNTSYNSLWVSVEIEIPFIMPFRYCRDVTTVHYMLQVQIE